MKYFVTIYIHPLKTAPHAFLGLTHTHPDELDKQGYIEIQKYKTDHLSGRDFLVKEKGKWYEQIYPSILDSNFKNEGFFGFAPVEFKSNHWGKVYENNQ